MYTVLCRNQRRAHLDPDLLHHVELLQRQRVLRVVDGPDQMWSSLRTSHSLKELSHHWSAHWLHHPLVSTLVTPPTGQHTGYTTHWSAHWLHHPTGHTTSLVTPLTGYTTSLVTPLTGYTTQLVSTLVTPLTGYTTHWLHHLSHML